MHPSNGSGRQAVAQLERALLLSGRNSDRVRVLGHRGSPGPGRPENSVAAVTAALRQGGDGAEIDVRLTADHQLVLSHDASVVTPDGRRLDVAASTRDELVNATGGDPVATLADVLAAVQRPVGSELLVEAKSVTDVAVAVRTAAVLADVLGSAAGSADVTVSSFDPALLRLIRRACADLPVRTALLGETWDPAATVVQRAHQDGHDEVHLALAAVRRSPWAVQTARALGLAVSCWTVNRRSDLRWVADLGVDAVITDDVHGARIELDRVAAGAEAGALAVASA
jgi:glycerophosphoryl diester phosphodiesterase